MSGDKTPPHAPTAYSYNTTTGATTTGHTVTIAPGQLDASITHFKQSTGNLPQEQIATLRDAMLIDDDFGKIPSAAAANTVLQTFITDHTHVMQTMHGVLGDFVARVQAAAQLGYQTDPETRRELAWARHENQYNH